MLIFVGLALKVYLVAAGGGIDATVLRLSGYARESTGVGAAGGALLGIRTLSGVGDIGATWLLVESMRRRRYVKASAIIFWLLIVASFALSGKRLAVTVPLLASIAAYSQFRRAITVRAAPIALSLAFLGGMGSLLFRILGPARIAGYNTDLASVSYAHGSIFRFYAYSLEFSTVEMTTVAIRAGDFIRQSFGGFTNALVTTNLYPFLYGIPRAVFPWKPNGFYDVSYGINGVLTGQLYSNTDVGFATTVVGTSYIFANAVGVTVALAATGLAVRRVDRSLNLQNWSTARIIGYAVLLNLVFHFFRQGTLGWTFIVGVVQQYGFLIGFLMLIWWSKAQERRDARSRECAAMGGGSA